MCHHPANSLATKKWLEADNWVLRIVAERLNEGPNAIPLSIIECGLLSSSSEVALAAAKACRGRTDIPVKVIEHWSKDSSWHTRRAVIEAAIDRPEVPLKIIERALSDTSLDNRKAAARACRGRKDITLETIENWMKSEDWHFRLSAMEAATGREDVPYSLIEQGMDDSHSVANAAKHAAASRGVIFRDFEPSGPVYEKCFGDVIVVATIPKDAHIIGKPGHECRTNKATIIDIIGKIQHKRVGISAHDRATVYHIGDKIEIEDFDFSEVLVGPSFYFYTSIEDAKRAF